MLTSQESEWDPVRPSSAIQQCSGPLDDFRRDDSHTQQVKRSGDNVSVAEKKERTGSPIPTVASSYYPDYPDYPIRTPDEYEAYSLQTMEKYRKSVTGRQQGRGRRGVELSRLQYTRYPYPDEY